MVNFDPTDYKKNSKANWNVVAPQYHNNWANDQIGPFKSTEEVVRIAEIKPSDKVLDLACGTGAVSKKAHLKLGRDGMLVGIDFSRTALCIAKQSVRSHNANFFEMDVENIEFRFAFDKILCQYGIMFFPNVHKVLSSARKMLIDNGKIVIAVHGTSEEVPYFSSVMNPVLKYIPDIRPTGVPSVHRFGNPEDLTIELEKAGFSDISVKKHIFEYDAGKFAEYWADYLQTTANSIRSRIERSAQSNYIKQEAELNVSSYTSDGRIIFPWTVLVFSAS